MTAMCEEVLPPAFTVAVAHQVLDHHDRGGTCDSCTGDDCEMTVWALEEIAKHHARRHGRRR